MNLELLLEAERRGILPPDKQALLAEARRRGLVSGEAPKPKSTGTKVKEFFLGDDDPTTQNMGEKIGTALNKAGEAMTFGLIGDEASAAVAGAIPGGMGYDERLAFERDQERILERDNPGMALGAELGGALVGALAPGGAIGTLGRGAGLMPRVAASAGAGAGMGGTYGFMEGEGLDDRLSQGQTGALIGGAVGAAVPAVGAGVQKVADSRVANRAIAEAVDAAPTSEQLRAMGRAAYQKIDDAGVAVRPDVVQGRAQEIARLLADEGSDPILTPNANRVADRLSGMVPEGANTVPFSELDKMRRIAGNAAGANPANKPDTRLSSMAVEQIDDFVRGLKPEDVDAGDLETLQTMLPKARELWSRMSKSQMIDDAIDASQNYRTGQASGLRAQFQRIVNNPKLSRGFTDAEIKMMRRVVNGTMPEQILNYLGSGLGMIAQGAVGGMLGGLPGVIAGGAAGAGARKLSERVVGKNAEIARALVASGKALNLPVATDSARRVTEALLRRTAAAGPQ